MRNEWIAKEAKRCQKYEAAIEVMFKKYKELSEIASDRLRSMVAARADKVIEREVFTTLMSLEAKNCD